MRDRERDGLCDCWMVQKHLIHFRWGDFAAGPVDHLLETPGQKDVSIAVHEPFVSGPEPPLEAILPIRVTSSFVTFGDAWASNRNLSALARRHLLAGRVHDRHFDANGHAD